MKSSLNYKAKYVVFYLIYLLTFSVSTNQIIAQGSSVNQHQVTNVIPPAPSAAAFEKYGNYPVNLANGTPNISIPLYTLQGSGVSLPLSLSYHAGGIKVDEISSWVGLGWSLNAGGLISRTIRGKPDELPNGYTFITNDGIPFPFTFTGYDFAIVESVGQDLQDSQPDIFSFNFGNYSGQFVFAGVNDIRILSQQDLRIEVVDQTSIDLETFKITTPDGIEYTFDQQETSRLVKIMEQGEANGQGYEPDEFAPTSWYLSKIYNPNTKDEIVLHYGTHFKVYDLAYFANHQLTPSIEIFNCPVVTTNTVGYTKKFEHGVHLESIEGTFGSIEFVTATEERLDFNNSVGPNNRLSEIHILGAEDELLKKYILDQEFIESTPPPGDPIPDHRKYRMYLASVQELASDGEAKPPYAFNYYSADLLPPRLSKNQDHWGYFNDADNDVFIPPSIYWSLFTGSNAIAFENATGADRETNTAVAHYGLISKVTYPTGGFTEFEYEGHQFTSSQEVSEVESFDSGSITAELNCSSPPCAFAYEESAEFTLQNAQEIVLHRLLQRSILGGPLRTPSCGILKKTDTNNWEQVPIVGTITFVDDGNNETETAENWNFQGAVTDYIELEDGTYKLWSKSGLLTSFASIRLWCESETGNLIFPIIKAGGARIKEITSSAADQSDPVVKTYEYDPFYFTGVDKPIYDHHQTTVVPSDACLVLDCSIVTLSSNSNVIDNPGNHIGYQKVWEIYPDNGKIYHEYSDRKNLPPNLSIHPDQPYLGTPWIDNSWGRGQLLKKIVFGEGGTLREELINSYNFDNPVNAFDALAMNARRMRITPCTGPFTIICDTDNIDDTWQECNVGNSFLGNYWIVPDPLYEWINDLQCQTHVGPCYQQPIGEERVANWGTLDDYAFEFYNIPSRRVTLEESITKYYDESGQNPIVTTTTYIYSDDHLNPIQINLSDDGNISQTTLITYAHEATGNSNHPYTPEMISRNMVSIPLETTVSGTVESAGQTIFMIHDDMILPYQFYKQLGGSTLELIGTLSYDDNDPFPDSYLKANDPNPEIYTWFAGGTSKQGLLQYKDYIGWRQEFDYHANSRLQSLQVDIDGQQTSYAYDGLQRLKTITSRDGDVITEQTYTMGGINQIATITTFTDDTPTQSNIQEYDGLGRPTTTEVNGVIKNDLTYNSNGQVATKTYLPGTITTLVYDHSPLNRVIEEIYPDQSSIQINYGTGGNLFRKTVLDENAHPTATFTNVLGQHRKTINAEGNSTSYLYDIKGNIEQVTAPNGETYVYDYDARNRLIEKSIPGAGTQYFTYNDRDLLETAEDANGKVVKTLYDTYGRPTKTGFPDGPAGLKVLTQTYYDDYASLIGFPSELRGACGSSAALTGKVVGTKVNILDGEDQGSEWIYTINCMDDFGRVIETKNNNHLDGTDFITTGYDLADNVRFTDHAHSTGDGAVAIHQDFEYDNFFRNTKVWHQINGGPSPMVSWNNYNDSDQLTLKFLGYTGGAGPGPGFLQKIDYEYNNRGWLTKINEVDAVYIPTSPIPDCDSIPQPPCPPVCDYTLTTSCTEGTSIYGMVANGGEIVFDGPYACWDIVAIQTAIEHWLTTEDYAYQSVVVTMVNYTLTISVIGSEVPFNYVNISNGQIKSAARFVASNCNRPQEPPTEADICTICRDHGYPCERCPYGELQTPCETCADIGLSTNSPCTECATPLTPCDGCTNLGYASCTDCPLTVKYLRPTRLEITYGMKADLSGGTDPVPANLVSLRETTQHFSQDGSIKEHSFEKILLTDNNSPDTNALVYVMDIAIKDQVVGSDNLATVINNIGSLIDTELLQAGFTNQQAMAAFTAALESALETAWEGLATDNDSGVMTAIFNNPALFAMDLYYSEGNQVVGTPGQANGNISGITWLVNRGNKQTYGFEYDALNRLKKAKYADQISDGEWSINEKYDMSASYDQVGNITHLERNGVLDVCQSPESENPLYVFGKIDILSYTYGGGNRLTSITEGSNTDHGFKGSGGNIDYDANGNMTTVNYKGGGFDYNHLNLPHHFGVGSTGDIDWKYNAAGTKLQKKVLVNGDPEASYIKDYIHGIEYKDGVIEAIYHSDGRAVLIPDPEDETSLIYSYEYNVKDHLGNVRVVFSDRNNNGYIEPYSGAPNKDYTEVYQENHYYPFGMGMEGPWENVTSDPENDYLFSGIERNRDLGLEWDMAMFRSYDPAIGRYAQVDPLAELSFGWTPYRFGFNNPILYSDPLGLFETKDEAKEYAKENGIKTGFFRRNKINENSDGTFSIDNKRDGTSTYKEVVLVDEESGNDGVVTGSLVTPSDPVAKEMESPLGFTFTISEQRDGSPVQILGGTVPTPASRVASGIKTLKGLKELPKLDATGKVHGILPKVKDLGKYSKDQLSILLKELKLSIKQRIKVTSKMGRDRPHGQRQGAEQDLVKSLEKFLGQ